MLSSLDNKVLLACYGMYKAHVCYFSRSMLEDTIRDINTRTLNRHLKKLVDLGLLNSKKVMYKHYIYEMSSKGLDFIQQYQKLVC